MRHGVLGVLLVLGCSGGTRVDDGETRSSAGKPLSSRVHLRAVGGKFLSAEGGGGDRLAADRSSALAWETFVVVDEDGGDLQHGDAVRLLAADGRSYVIAHEGGGGVLSVRSQNPGPWETFVVQRLAGAGRVVDGDQVHLRAHNGQYVVAEGGGDGDVNANRELAGAWETFTVFREGSPLLAPGGGGGGGGGTPAPVRRDARLRASGGQYLVAEGGGGDVVNADRLAAGPWETFGLVDLNGGALDSGDRVQLATHDGAHFVSAPGDGSLHARATAAGAQETFELVRDGAFVALRAANGRYVVAEGGGGGVVRADRQAIGAWEQLTLELDGGGAGAHAGPLVGRLRIDAGGFVDDTGPVLPVFCHFGEAFSRYTRDRAGVRRQLDVIAQAGYHGIRFWTTLGGSYWSGREVSEQVTPNYWGQLRDFLRELEARQLRAVISQGDIGLIRDRTAFARQLSDVLDEVGAAGTTAIIEGGNETWQTGEADPVRLAAFVSAIEARHPQVLYTLSSPPGESKAELDAWSIAPADLFDVHGYRGGHWWDKVRHIFSIAYEGQPRHRLGWQGEPTGPGGAVSVTDNQGELDDDTLAAMAVMSLMSRQAWCYMSGPGVLFDSPIEQQPGFWSVPRAAATLPRDVMRYANLFHGGARWANERIFAPEGETRADHALASDGRFVVLLYGPELRYSQTAPATIERVVEFGGKARLIIGHR